MADVHPEHHASSAARAWSELFPARPTGQIGHYVADVTFPSAGTWSARIFDGFTDVTPHRIVDAERRRATRRAPAGFPWPQTVMIAFLALLFLGGLDRYERSLAVA